MPETTKTLPEPQAKKNAQLPEILRNPQFLLGAAEPHQFPDDDLLEIAFAGRSNVGKSSAINAICNRRKLARTSKVPGRTQQINFFSMGNSARLADLPGYGFAQVPLSVKKKWQETIHKYLAERQNLRVLVLLMDIRHPLTELDWQMIRKVAATTLYVEKQIATVAGQFEVEPFSSQSYLGVNEMRLQLAEWVRS